MKEKYKMVVGENLEKSHNDPMNFVSFDIKARLVNVAGLLAGYPSLSMALSIIPSKFY